MFHSKGAGLLPAQTFNFKGTPIRAAQIENSPWFAAKDICDALGLKNSRKAIQKLDEDEAMVYPLVTPSRGKQMLSFVNLSGLFGLVFQSRKKEAKTFRKWVTGEVLPGLMQSGVYSVIPNSIQSVVWKDQVMYPYRAFLKAIGASTNGYAYERARRYPGHFDRLGNGMLYVTRAMAQQIAATRRIYQNRKALKEMQLNLPFNYNLLTR